MANDPVDVVQTQLLVTLAQAVLVMHQTGYMPSRLREQLARQIGELEALTVLQPLLAAKCDPSRRQSSPSLKLVEPAPPDSAA